MTRIIILGYMGAGKTTIGRALANQLRLPFYDLDTYIENRMHKTIKQLFDTIGEEGFRRIENKMLHEVCEFENVIVSCGGGTPCFFDNMEYMNSQGDTVYMKADTDTLYRHLKMGGTVRPLLLGKDEAQLKAHIESQLAEREPFYTRAKHVIDVSLLDDKEKIAQTARRLAGIVGEKQQAL